MTTISAKAILKSQHAVTGDMLATLLLRYPRCIHDEFLTHRVFSRNASSLRAVPVAKLIQDVVNDPFMPIYWGKNRKGMQADEELTGRELEDAKKFWDQAKNDALIYASELAGVGAHKQIANRVLEPFSHITVVVSATEWTNFFALRIHPTAEPHMRKLAEVMEEALVAAPAQMLKPGDWHLPFVSAEDKVLIASAHPQGGPEKHNALIDACTQDAIKLSVARCASTSYKTVEGFDMTMERAVALHDKLVSSVPLHASPCEHVAQADTPVTVWPQEIAGKAGIPPTWIGWDNQKQHGNFVGFRQYRKMLPGECL